MKYIIAIIQPSKLEAVHEALKTINIAGMTVSEVQGYGRQMGKNEIYRGAEYTVNFIPKTKIEIAVDDSAEDAVVSAIKSTSETGKIGDGKIFTLDLKEATRIRTGETGSSAL